ncbi:MAG: hypothetical protein ACFFFC_19075 [Candidatus Thorarchaeota archaeon]
MGEYQESYPKERIHEQLGIHLNKRVKIWAAGRVQQWSGTLLHVGLDYIELGQPRGKENWKRRYFLLGQVYAIEPQE